MPDNCKICLEPIEEPTLEEHIAVHHMDHGESVETIYPDLHETMFVDGEVPDVGSDDGPQGGGSAGGGARAGPDGDGPGEEGAGGSGPGGGNPGNGPGGVGSGRVSSSGGSSDGGSGGGYGPASGEGLAEGIGNKWMVVGVGGAGNHIVDAILMRRDTLREDNHSLASVWEGGLSGYGCLNTNITEVGETYYAQEDRKFQREALMTNCMIGYQEHNYSGAGRNWRIGRELMQKDFEGEKNAIRDRMDIGTTALEGSQAVMLVHSVTKGTGCGSTPVLAENIREMVTAGTGIQDRTALSKPILSSVVLPSNEEFRSSEMVRGVVGMSYLAGTVDGIIPLDNSKLNELSTDMAVEIDRAKLDRYNPPKFADVNRLIVTFLEAFTMSSTPQSTDAEATARINGDVFDVQDSFRPVERKYPTRSDGEYQPAVVMAPVIGRSVASSFDVSRLDTLARSTLLKGQLVEFDPSTAWGGTFMMYGPEEKMSEVAPLLNDGQLTTVLSGEDFFDRESHDRVEPVDIYVDQLVVPHLDDVHLWGLVWNPHLPSLERMYDHAKRIAEESDSVEAEDLRENWEHVEPLFERLGRENMG